MYDRINRGTLSLGIAVLMLGVAILTSCGKGYRQAVIVNGQKAEVLASLEGGAPPALQEVWVAGRIILFRTDSAISSPSGQLTGVAGHVYRVTTDMKLEELGRFDQTLSNSVLLARYGK